MGFDVLVTAVPEFFAWLFDSANVLVTAIPDFGFVAGLPFTMIVGGFILLMAWHYDYV